MSLVRRRPWFEMADCSTLALQWSRRVDRQVDVVLCVASFLCTDRAEFIVIYYDLTK